MEELKAYFPKDEYSPKAIAGEPPVNPYTTRAEWPRTLRVQSVSDLKAKIARGLNPGMLIYAPFKSAEGYALAGSYEDGQTIILLDPLGKPELIEVAEGKP